MKKAATKNKIISKPVNEKTVKKSKAKVQYSDEIKVAHAAVKKAFKALDIEEQEKAAKKVKKLKEIAMRVAEGDRNNTIERKKNKGGRVETLYEKGIDKILTKSQMEVIRSKKFNTENNVETLEIVLNIDYLRPSVIVRILEKRTQYMNTEGRGVVFIPHYDISIRYYSINPLGEITFEANDSHKKFDSVESEVRQKELKALNYFPIREE